MVKKKAFEEKKYIDKKMLFADFCRWIFQSTYSDRIFLKIDFGNLYAFKHKL